MTKLYIALPSESINSAFTRAALHPEICIHFLTTYSHMYGLIITKSIPVFLFIPMFLSNKSMFCAAKTELMNAQGFCANIQNTSHDSAM